MKVIICERKNNSIVVEYPMHLQNVDGIPTKDDDYIKEAWKAAVEDLKVDPDRMENYYFKFFHE